MPRDPGVLFYDGGDKIVSVGGAIAVTMAVWPDFPDSILFAGAWEIYPTSRWDTGYIIPVGQNVPRPRDGFRTVGLNVQAVVDGTSVNLDLNADGTFENTVLLDQGQQFTQVSGVMAGAWVEASAPVQVHVFTGDPREPAGQYEARAYTILPRSQWTDEYLAPRSSDGDYWLYNPDPTNPLVVAVQTVTGTTTITIPAVGVGRYPPLPSPVLSSPTGARFTSTDGRPFYGVVALDDDFRQDWGYPLLPTDNLTSQALVGWAPGNANIPPDGDESRIYVTAATTTTVFVDYSNDETIDASFLVVPLAEVPIADPDHDLTGARLFTADRVPFVAVWGQDQTAPSAFPSIDVGTNIVPLAMPSIQKTYTLVEEGYDCGTLSRGYTLRFQLQLFNASVNRVPDVVVRDELPAGVAYVPDSTVVGGQPRPDDSSGTPFPLDEGGYNIGSIPERGMVSITFDAAIEDTGTFPNQAEMISPPSDPAIVNVTLPFRLAGYQVAKTLLDPPGGQASAGQIITFGLTITDTGTVAITQLPLRDEFYENHLTFRSASVPPTNTSPGVLNWTDLVSVLGDLLPNMTFDLAVSFSVDDVPPEVTGTMNVALAEGVQDRDGVVRAIVCSDAMVSFAPPAVPPPTPTPEAPPPTPSLPPAPQVTPTPPVLPTSPPPSPTPSVRILPETGSGQPARVDLWTLASWLALGFPLVWAFLRRRR